MDAPPPPPPAAVSQPPTPIDNDPISVDPLTIRAARPLTAGDAVFSAVSITPETLQANPRLDEALASVPGVSLFRRTSSLGANPTTQGLSLRGIAGSGAGRALVTLDRIPQNDPFGGWVIWSALPSEAVGGASVVRGSGSGPYGAGALTGVVNLTSGRDDLLTVSGGELEQGRVAGAAAFSSGFETGYLAASGGHSGGWVPVRQGAGAADQPLTLDFANAQGRFVMMRGGDILQVNGLAYREARGSGLAGAASRAQGGNFGVTWRHDGSADWRASAWIAASDLHNTSVSVAPGRATTTPANSQDATPATGYGGNVAFVWEPWRVKLEVGVDARGARGETQERFRVIGGAYTRSRVAGGANLDIGLYLDGDALVGRWTFGGGLRLDRWSTFDGKRLEQDLTSGSVTLDHRPDDRDGILPTARFGAKRAFGDSYLRAAAYAGFRPPTLNELHRPFRVGNDITEANPALEPERLYGLEIGAGGATPLASWSLTLFANRLDDPVTNVTVGIGPFTDPIAGVVPAGGVLRQRRNAGRIDAWGVEGEGSWTVGETLKLRAAFSYTHARVDGQTGAPQLTGLRPAETPELTVTAGIDWTVIGPLTLHADVRGESVRYDDDLNTRRLGPSVSLNVQADWALTDKATAFVALDNAGDADVQTGRTADGVVSYGPPRAVRAGLRLTF